MRRARKSRWALVDQTDWRPVGQHARGLLQREGLADTRFAREERKPLRANHSGSELRDDRPVNFTEEQIPTVRGDSERIFGQSQSGWGTFLVPIAIYPGAG